MRIGILQCGAVPEPLRAAHGTYAAMMQRMLGAGKDTAVFDVTAGTLPEPGDYDAYVLTGSSAGVYDDLPWIGALTAFLRRARGQAKLVGICFGHQAMAEAFGGRVVKSERGWGIGLQRYDVVERAWWMDGADHVDIPASHQDQVVEPPPGTAVTLASGFTPYAGLNYGDAISFQFHPEFGAAFGTALVEMRRGRYGPAADTAIRSYEKPDDCDRVAGWIGRFIDGP